MKEYNSNEDLFVLSENIYVRYDNDGVSMIFAKKGVDPLIVNQTITDVLHMLEKPIKPILVIQRMSEKYPSQSMEQIQSDVLQIISFLAEKKIIKTA